MCKSSNNLSIYQELATTSLALLSFPSTFISLFYESKEKVDTCIGEGNILGERLQSKAEERAMWGDSYLKRLLSICSAL